MLDTYIYESPDSGETIYRRKHNSTQRELYKVSDKKLKLEKEIQHNKLWEEIRVSSLSDPVLKQMLDQIEIYYTLKHFN